MHLKRHLLAFACAAAALAPAAAGAAERPNYGSSVAGFLHQEETNRRTNPAFDRTIAARPPMGWNSWNAFRCSIDERKVRDTADQMVKLGLREAGYVYVVIDDCWQSSRDAAGRLVADPVRFPSGIKALADYVHQRGLKFGIYSSAGGKTCQGRPGSRGYEWTDAKTFADWGVDYLKYDWCYVPNWQDPFDAYARMRDALVATGRPILFNVASGPRDDTVTWAPQVGHTWRVFKDIRPCWDCTGDRATNGIMSIVDRVSERQLSMISRPGYWNDLDMLEVGNHGLTADEAQAHFALWAVMAAPLTIGTDLTRISPEALAILKNPELIAANQDRLGLSAYRYRDYGDTEVWRKWQEDGPDGRRRDVFLLLNRSDRPQRIPVELDEGVAVRDLLARRDLATPKDGVFAPLVKPHAAVVVRVDGMAFKN